jgi:hypothetical protein
MTLRLVYLAALLLVLLGCNTMRTVMGLPSASDPTVNIKSAETRWVLIKNPRFGDVPSEPEYVWVEEDRIPFTFKGLISKNAILAPPEIVAKYGQPPGGGKISPRQGVPSLAAAEPARAGTGQAAARGGNGRLASVAPVAAPAPPPRRGIVVYVDTSRVVVDLTAADGVHAGMLLSLRRDRIPIVHPVTGEVLGELDEEIATARVVEIRDRFSVAEVQNVSPGAQIQLRDRVIIK